MFKDLLIKLLNAAGASIKEDADETAIKEACESFAQTAKKAEAPVTLSADVIEALKTLPGQVNALAADLAKIKQAEAQNEIAVILSAAAKEGKVVPKEATEGATAMTAPQLRLLVASLPVTVPLDRRTSAAPIQGMDLITNSAEEAVRKQLGISKEDWAKQNAA